MKKKKWIPLVIAVVVLVLGIVGCIALKNYNASQIKPEESELLLSYGGEEFEALQFIDKHGDLLRFELRDGIWVYADDPDGCEVSIDELDVLLTPLMELSIQATIKDADNVDEYGLEEPLNTITLQASGEDVVINVGVYNQTTLGQYVCLGDDTSTIYLVDAALGGLYELDLMDMIIGENFPSIAESSIQKVAFRNNGVTSGIDSERYSDVVMLSYNDYIEYNCTDFAKYGLKDSKLQLAIEYLVEEEVEEDALLEEDAEIATEEVPEVTSKLETFILYLGDKYMDEESGVECYYVRAEGSKEVHSISVELLEPLLPDSLK